jgi:GTP pyrophosphokinase
MDKILSEIKTKYNAKDQKLIDKAFDFACKAHGKQKREAGNSYIEHPLMVAHVLSELNLDAETIAAALLHDTIEDTKADFKEIEKHFGDNIVFLVNSVTNLKNVDFSGEKELAENFRKMIVATAKDIRVVLIKLADVLHNMRTIEHLPEERRTRYAQEVIEIYAQIAGRLGIGWIRGELEDLAFPYVLPEEHEKLSKQVKNLVKESRAHLEDLKPKVIAILGKEKIKLAKIDARTKHLFSLWRKLKRYGGDLSKIYDFVAFRIIVPTVHDCYEVLGALHNNYKPLPGRIKDYIAIPKPNGYRSLHTTVFCDKGIIMEFQIRTEQMHQEAEFGIASHWAYKEKVKPFKKKLAWIQQLQNWQKSIGSEEFLDGLKIDFFQNRIFVFTPNGDVVDLPEDATPIDFAYAIHSDIGDKAVLAKVNEKPVPFSSSLQNNDMVEIETAKNKKPSPDWLSFVKTSRARSKIRDALRKK